MAKNEKNLREMLDEFDALIREFDDADLDVDAATGKFADAEKLALKINEKLSAEESKLTVIREDFARKFGDAAAENTIENEAKS